MTFRLSETWGSSNSFGSSKTIFPFENTFGSDQIAKKYLELAQLGTPYQPDPPSQADPPCPPDPRDSPGPSGPPGPQDPSQQNSTKAVTD